MWDGPGGPMRPLHLDAGSRVCAGNRPNGPNRNEFKVLTSDGWGEGSSELLQRAFDPGPASTPDWAPDPWLEPPGASDSDSTPPEDWDSGA
jgi:hypothetical protein